MTTETADTIAQRLQDLARRLRRLRPDHRNPERYFLEKAELEHEMASLARQVAGGAP